MSLPATPYRKQLQYSPAAGLAVTVVTTDEAAVLGFDGVVDHDGRRYDIRGRWPVGGDAPSGFEMRWSGTARAASRATRAAAEAHVVPAIEAALRSDVASLRKIIAAAATEWTAYDERMHQLLPRHLAGAGRVADRLCRSTLDALEANNPNLMCPTQQLSSAAGQLRYVAAALATWRPGRWQRVAADAAADLDDTTWWTTAGTSRAKTSDAEEEGRGPGTDRVDGPGPRPRGEAQAPLLTFTTEAGWAFTVTLSDHPKHLALTGGFQHQRQWYAFTARWRLGATEPTDFSPVDRAGRQLRSRRDELECVASPAIHPTLRAHIGTIRAFITTFAAADVAARRAARTRLLAHVAHTRELIDRAIAGAAAAVAAGDRVGLRAAAETLAAAAAAVDEIEARSIDWEPGPWDETAEHAAADIDDATWWHAYEIKDALDLPKLADARTVATVTQQL